MRGSHLPYAKFSLQSVKFLLSYAMRIMFGLFLFVCWVFSTQKCEAVIFTKFGLACVHARLLDYLDELVLHRAHASCSCAHVHMLHMPDVMSLGLHIMQTMSS